MKPQPTSTQNLPEKDLSHPNDDGCVLGTAGRDEDPNTTTDWDHESDSAGNVLTPEDARGLPGYPKDSESDQTQAMPTKRLSNGEPQTGIPNTEKRTMTALIDGSRRL